MSADATNTILEPEEAGGRTILLGWIRGFRPGGGWNGTLSLPRVLTFAEDGVPGLGPGGGDALRVGEAEAERAASSAPPTGADSGASDAVADEPAPAQPADATKPEGEAGRDPDGGGRRDADGPAEPPGEAARADEL